MYMTMHDKLHVNDETFMDSMHVRESVLLGMPFKRILQLMKHTLTVTADMKCWVLLMTQSLKHFTTWLLSQTLPTCWPRSTILRAFLYKLLFHSRCFPRDEPRDDKRHRVRLAQFRERNNKRNLPTIVTAQQQTASYRDLVH